MMQAMIFAAGLGTRLKPLTDTMPKALVSIGGQPLLWHVIMKLRMAGYERMVVNVHHFAEQIVDYLYENDNFGLDIRLSDESARLLDTGGGIRHALPLFDRDSPILIHNVDILSNIELPHLTDVEKTPDAMLLVSQRQTKRYLLFDEKMLLRGWTNIETGEVKSPCEGMKPASMNRLAFSGIHVVWPRVFPLLEQMPERFGIMDFYLKYCHQCVFMGCERKELKLMDVGKIDTLHDAETFLQLLKS